MSSDLRWRRTPPAPLPPLLHSWLCEPGSLTRRCQRLAQTFTVQLLAQGRGVNLLTAGPARQTLVREVLLCCDGAPVIFAHTTLSTVVRGRLNRWLARLGSRSLGSLLFTHPGFRRGPIRFCRLDARHALYRAAVAAMQRAQPDAPPLPAQLWARQSTHYLAAQAVTVCEIFLPAVLHLPAAA